MAVAPLFVASMAALHEKLRLSGAKVDADNLIDEATQKVRTLFFRRLGAARINEILGVAFVENATTEAEMLRTVANTAEVDWVRLVLMDVLPTLYMDGGSQPLSAWNDEAAFRRTSDFERNDKAKRLWAEIQEALEILAGTDAFGDELTIKASTIYPTNGDDGYVNAYPGAFL